MSAEESGLYRNLGCSFATALGLVTSSHGQFRATVRSHTTGVCRVCTQGGKGEEESWSRSASLPTAAYTRGKEEPDRTLRMGLASVFRALRDPRIRFSHISTQSCWAFNKIKERKPNAGGHLATRRCPVSKTGLRCPTTLRPIVPP